MAKAKLNLKPAPAPAAKEHRSVEAIRQDYTNLAAKAGQLQYQIFTLTKELGAVNESLRDLNFEAAASQAAAPAAAEAQVTQ